jgi:hypothetical protein
LERWSIERGQGMNKHHVFGVVLTAMVLSVFVTGCYTQVGTVRDDRDDNYSSRDRDRSEYGYTDSQPGYDTTVADSGRYAEEPYETVRHRAYFDYYYPTFSVGFGWYGPWDWGYGYDPFFYPWYYSSWGYPGISPYPWYVYPYYRDPGYYGPYYSHTYGGGRTYGHTRTFGNTRTGGSYRAGSAVYRGGGATSLINPAGTRYAPRSNPRVAPSSQPRVSTSRRTYNSGRATSSPQGKTYRGGSTRGGTRGGYGNTPPRSRYEPPQSSGGSRSSGAGRSGGGRSYSPPSSPPSHGGSSAPPSSGGRGSSGSRGGSRR